MSNNLAVLVTGSSSGFGRLIVDTLAREGHTIFATMRGVEGKNADKAQAIRDFAATENLAIHVLELDVTDDASVNAAVEAAAAEAGTIDVVVNNAGLGNFGVSEAFDIAQSQKLFDVNVFGVQRVTQAALPYMRKQGSGVIFNVSSGLGRFVFPFMGVYNATKWALEAISETLRYEVGPLGVDVVVIEPGAFGTSFGANMIQGVNGAVHGEYGVVAEVFQQFAAGFEQMIGNTPDPQIVADAVLEILNQPQGAREFRRLVGPDMQGLQPINELSEQIQQAILGNMGLGTLLPKSVAAEEA